MTDQEKIKWQEDEIKRLQKALEIQEKQNDRTKRQQGWVLKRLSTLILRPRFK